MNGKTTLVTLLTASVIGVATFTLGAEDHPGKALFVKEKCNTCHAVSSQGIEAGRGEDKAPDMADAVSEIPNAEWAVKFVMREETKDGKKHRRPYKGTEKDLKVIVDWLLTLKSS